MSRLHFTNNKWIDHANEFTKMIFSVLCSGNVEPLMYDCGTVHGIYNQTDDGKDIIAIDNDEPHNGDFGRFVEELEKYATRTGERIAICAFMNERLYYHMRKRPGWGNIASTMDRLEYYPQTKEN